MVSIIFFSDYFNVYNLDVPVYYIDYEILRDKFLIANQVPIFFNQQK